MPPRKRATPEADDQAQTPVPAPDLEQQPATPAAATPAAPEPVAPALAETPEPVAPDPDPAPVAADEGWEASAAALDSAPALCRDHYPDPITIATSVTAVACEHGSWIRTGS
jgi:hypothetical protein